MNNLTPEEVLLKAANEIARCGHWKGWFSETDADPDSPVCAVGSINRVVFGKANMCDVRWIRTGQLDLNRVATMRLEAYLEQAVGEDSAALWNDRADTSAEDVILAMKKAAHGE